MVRFWPLVPIFCATESVHDLEALLIVENNSKETTTVPSNEFKVMDRQNRSFSPYSGGSVYLGSDFLLGPLQPGLTKRIATVRSLLGFGMSEQH